MRDFRKFCRPSFSKNPQVGDVSVKLKCGEIGVMTEKEYLKVLNFFEVDSFVGEDSPNFPGNIVVINKETGKQATFSASDYNSIKDQFEVVNIVGSKKTPFNNHEYVDLGLPSGTLWATVNVGATSETEVGDYYKFGETTVYDGTDYNTSAYDLAEDLSLENDAANVNWSGDWHIPTRSLWNELIDNTTHTYISDYNSTGVNVIKFAKTNDSSIFIILPVGGSYTDGVLNNSDTGYYWSNTLYYKSAYYTVFTLNSYFHIDWKTAYGHGFLVRPVCDSIDNLRLAQEGNIICHNDILDLNAIFSFADWLNLDDNWNLVGLYGITTYEEEAAEGGDYVIMSNGYTLIIKPEDYSKVSSNWEQVDIIRETKLVCKYNVTSTSDPTSLITNYENNVFKSMEIDGVMLDELVTAYTFDTIGVHTVKYELYDETKLGNNAYVFDTYNLIECIIPNSVTSIGGGAFRGCGGLKSISIPSGVTTISDNAFYGCISLTSIDIPDSVTSIGDSAFKGCSLTNINIPNSVTSIGDNAFRGTDALKVLNYNAKCELSTSFRSTWSNLETVIIGDSTPSIGSGALSGCTNLTNITIGNSVTSIGNVAFAGCSSLTSIVSNATTAPTIQSNTFQAIHTDGTLTVPNSSTGYDVWMGTGDYYLGKYSWTKVEQ